MGRRGKIICRDWRDIGVPPDADAILTDPPYGLGYAHGLKRKPRPRPEDKVTRRQPPYWMSCRGISHPDTLTLANDDHFDPRPILAAGLPSIIWGVDHWGRDEYPMHARGSAWIAWCKLGRWMARHGDCFSDVEFALLRPSRGGRIKAYSHTWKGIIRDPDGEDRMPDDRSDGRRSRHPTQKPVALMAWCLQQLRLPRGGLIYDPYAGSGTVGVAALRGGYRYIGVEIDPIFAAAARARLALLEDG